MIIAAIDVETTGIHETAEIIEIGVVLYDSDSKSKISEASVLFRPDVWDEKAEKSRETHHITKGILIKYGKDIKDYDIMNLMGVRPEYIISHNAEFEKKMLSKHWPFLNEILWICTMRDLDHSLFTKYKSWALQHLATDYKVNIIEEHRALDDARTCGALFMKHNIDDVIRFINGEKYTGLIKTQNEPEEIITELKRAGCRWSPAEQRWVLLDKPKSVIERLRKTLDERAPHLSIEMI